MMVADLIIFNRNGGSIFTCSPRQPWIDAIAVTDGKIIATGSATEIEQLAGPVTKRIDLEGRLLLPSFSDMHTHFLLGSLGSLEIDLKGISGKEEFRSRTRKSLNTLNKGEWLTGGYWNDEEWPAGQTPDKSWLDDIAPDNPVLLYRHDIHQAVCNTRALEAAGFLDPSLELVGGRIARDADGDVNGKLFEGAVTRIMKIVPAASREQKQRALKHGMKMANALGLTAISDMIEGPDDIIFYQEMERAGQLTCRFELLMPLPQRETLIKAGQTTGSGSDMVHLGPMKGFVDGSLGSRTAFMNEPYTDEPENSGHLLEMATPPQKLGEMMKEAHNAGFRTAIHAIGDNANQIVLDLYRECVNGGGAPQRNRVEHAQHLLSSQYGRFNALDLIVSMQPVHMYDDGNFAELALGPDRLKGAYAFRSLIDAGARLVFGSDWPVADINPLMGIWVAVTRQTSNGKNPDGWIPSERISLPEAVLAYTANQSFARGMESTLGRLEVGYNADMVILEKNIFECDPDDIRTCTVAATFLKGKQVYPEN